MFNIPEKKFTAIELDFEIPTAPGFCHIQNELYLAGGSLYPQFYNDFRRINALGKAVTLKSLATGKSSFPMTNWERQNSVITIGGKLLHNKNLNKVQQFMIAKSEWKALASLSQKIAGSSATFLNDVLYSIGGDGSTSSVCWLDLLNEKAKWSLAKTLGQSDFSDY